MKVFENEERLIILEALNYLSLSAIDRDKRLTIANLYCNLSESDIKLCTLSLSEIAQI